jgi:hypothetical protein
MKTEHRVAKPHSTAILKIPRDWSTPATKYPNKKVGSAEICSGFYKRGMYHMHQVKGYLFWDNHYRIPLTTLKIDGRTVMTDGPIDWIGMQELARHSKGKVLVVGLGLGLVVHALKDNRLVEKIDVVELNQDVIDLIEPLLPEDDRRRVYQGNGFEWKGEYDTVIVDILVKSGDIEGVFQAGSELTLNPTMVFLRFEAQFRPAKVFLWGIINPDVNPAIIDLDKIKGQMRRY